MHHSHRHLVLALLAALALSACGDQPSPSPTPAASLATSPTPSPTPVATPRASPSSTPDEASLPFTVLILGLDDGARADAIMVVGVDPARRTLAMASIPRDTIDVPLPDGGIWDDRKINSLYQAALKDRARFPDGPGRTMAEAVGTMLGIRIDYVAATTFAGFERLATALGGVPISLARPIIDPTYQITSTNVGIRFPAGSQVLDGKRSMIFVRTRGADNDFERQRRQQQFLIAAGRRLADDPSRLVELTAVASSMSTDFPLDRVPTLLRAMGSIEDGSIQQVVLGPTKYETGATCACGYALAPKLQPMRDKAAQLFPWAVRR